MHTHDIVSECVFRQVSLGMNCVMLRANMRMRAAGSEKSFAAGADIKEMAGKDFMGELSLSLFPARWFARWPTCFAHYRLFQSA